MNKNILTILILFCFFVTSCVEDVDITRGQKKQVVVNCLLVNDTVQELTLNYSEPGFYAYFEPIVDAKVTLWIENKCVGEFKLGAKNKWYLKYRPFQLKEYTLKVEVPGQKIVSATTTFPQAPLVRRAQEYDKASSFGFAKKNHDVFWIFANGLAIDVDPKETLVFKRTPHLINPLGCNLLSVDEFNSDNRGLDNNIYPIYYYYVRVLACDNEQPQYFEVSELTRGILTFRGVSKEYDLYLKSALQKILLYTDEDDPKIMLDESAVYSNIINGVGIFGACNDVAFACIKFTNSADE